MNETFYISGLYSGPSPSAGLGVARSLRAAFPSAKPIGVDYWAGSSGLHHEVFNATWLKPSWDLIEPELYAQEIKADLDRGAFFLPTLDLEVGWLARTFAPHRRLLSPSPSALARTRKPNPSIVELLPLTMPLSLDLSSTSDEDVHAFYRAHSWRVWLKGLYHEAVAVKNWRELEQERARLRERWHTEHLSIQVHVRGYEESICFTAVGGKLADAVYVRKLGIALAASIADRRLGVAMIAASIATVAVGYLAGSQGWQVEQGLAGFTPAMVAARRCAVFAGWVGSPWPLPW
jgi:diaminopimelate decarboxylase